MNEYFEGQQGQFRWDPLEYEDQGFDSEFARKQAIAERTRWVNLNTKKYPNMRFKMWTLIGQLRQYAGLGKPDGRIRNVYYVSVDPK